MTIQQTEQAVSDSNITNLIEGFLFASSVPLSIDGIIRLFPEEEKPKADQVKQCLAEIKTRFADRGITLVEIATGYRFQVAQPVAPYIAKNLEEKPTRYSRALLETLALIAYRQPITRGEIEDIRGIVVSTHIIKTLDEHEWIRVVGHKNVPGKPALYATTKAFLDHFGLKALDELPPLVELKDFESLANATDAPLEVIEVAEEITEEIEVAVETEGEEHAIA